MLRQMLREFVHNEVEPQAADFDAQEKFNLPLFRKLGELGLLGLTVPEQLGGTGLDAVAAVIAHEELASSDPGFCLAYLAHAMLAVNNLNQNGTDELKQKLLPPLCSGEKVACMAMSEPHVGTDVLGMKSLAIRHDTHYTINGRKMWITNGVLDEQGTPADVVLLYAKTGTPDGPLSTFIVEKSFKGYKTGQKIQHKTGMRASNTAELVFDNCEVPHTHRLGEEGKSLLHMMRNLEIERLTLAAMSLGIAKRSLQIMNRYANERQAFGRKLNHFGQVQAYIGNSFAQYQAARAYVYTTAGRLDLASAHGRVHSDGVKLVAAPMGKQVADAAMQVLGGYGYVGEYVVERLWRDAKLLEIGGGTLESHQKNISKDLSKAPQLLQE